MTDSEMIAAWRAGDRVRDICPNAKTLVYRALDREGVTERRKLGTGTPLAAETRAWILEQVRAGVLHKVIAHRAGVHVDTVGKIKRSARA